MASYPGSIPSLGTYTSADYPQVSHFNTPNDEIEAICSELGTGPTQIVDDVTVSSSPSSVGNYLDMVATILRTMAGVPHQSDISIDAQNRGWWNAAVPTRYIVYGNLQLATLAPGGAAYAYPFGAGSSATEANARIVTTHASRYDSYFYIELATAMGSGANDILQLNLYKNGSPTVIFMTVPPGTVGVYRRPIKDFSVAGETFAAGDLLSVQFYQHASASGNSGQIGAWGFEGRQIG